MEMHELSMKMKNSETQFTSRFVQSSSRHKDCRYGENQGTNEVCSMCIHPCCCTLSYFLLLLIVSAHRLIQWLGHCTRFCCTGCCYICCLESCIGCLGSVSKTICFITTKFWILSCRSKTICFSITSRCHWIPIHGARISMSLMSGDLCPIWWTH